MARFLIPTRSDDTAFWSQRVALDGSDYLLSFAWSGRDNAWYLSIANANGDPLINSIKLISNWSLLRRFAYVQGIPPGALVLLDPSGKLPRPGYFNLASVFLVYYDAAELDALRAASATGEGA